ncbi:KfrA_N domain-containing protein [Hyphomicrobiales bacterium]|nr:KfrA_N domain-containing protein [Hyphomicrobiales bacterium]CAH1702159.1 KfrA_N domain-containing protein [Hyphomicrobiales bacterium]CAI0346363.1 KfrA_N domain-containing protein [Hyphomicrobiales bacterium]
MPTKREVWLAADRLREKSEPVSVRSVRAALPYGGSYRDIGPHLADWKAERSYTRVIEFSGLPDHIQTQLARAGTTLWQAALQDATKFLSAEREQARAVAKVDQEMRDEALAAADVLEARVGHLRAEIERLKSELAAAHNQSAGYLAKLMELRGDPADPDGVRQAERRRSRAFWNDLVIRIRDMLIELPPGNPGMTLEQLLDWMPGDLRDRANLEGEVLDRSTLSKRLYERDLRQKHVIKVEGYYRAAQ